MCFTTELSFVFPPVANSQFTLAGVHRLATLPPGNILAVSLGRTLSKTIRLMTIVMAIAGFATMETGQVAQSEEPIPAWEQSLLKKFERQLLPSLSDATAGCIDCHASPTMSNLVLSGNPLEDLRRLLEKGYLSTQGPDSLLGRITSQSPDRRMPKDAPAWTARQIKRLQRFVQSVEELESEAGIRPDEQFPRSLLSSYHDISADSTAAPSQFISYRQLKAKIQAIFGDNWVRGDRDLFAENLDAFGGADFNRRFNESHTPTAAYLSSVEMMSRDVASRAYRLRTGPFVPWREEFEVALADLSEDKAAGTSTDAAITAAVSQLYRRILFRDPTATEIDDSMRLLNEVQQLSSIISSRDTELGFEVTVTDPATQLSTRKTISIPIRGWNQGVQQSLIDQSKAAASPDKASQIVDRIFGPLVEQIAKQILAPKEENGPTRQSLGRIDVLDPQAENGPEDSGCGLVILHNRGTKRNVSFAGVEVRSLDGLLVRSIDCDDPAVSLEGAWESKSQDGFKTYEDANQHKGQSRIQVALGQLPADQYEVLLLWRAAEDNSDRVLVELYGNAKDHQLAIAKSMLPSTPGVARFEYDCSDDSVPYIDFPAVFQFDPQSYVEISNAGTYRTVTAGAVDIVNSQNPDNNFLIDSEIAQGAEDWQQFDEGRFKAYNVRGKKLHDDNNQKGDLTLRYQLNDRIDHGWQADQFYRVHLYFPGKRDQESRVPVNVHASRSSPIVQVDHPQIARAGTRIELNASSSYTVQGSQLDFQWRQISGPKVAVQEWEQASLDFVAPRLSSVELAWTSLVSALLRHPDFLFCFPPTLQSDAPNDQPQLHLLKLAMDLVGRPPTEQELEQLNSGVPLSELVDHYLNTDDFRDFYFHRVRLYLESQGTELQDEPARLWSYVVFNDLPFQEILTADYTVGPDFERLERPAHHGKTGVLTTPGFIDGKPGLPHYNYAAQVSMLFLGYVYEVPPEIVEQREGVTALGTTDPNSSCYSCHKILTPLAFQRLEWTDQGEFRQVDEEGLAIDASDRGVVDEYPYKGQGLAAFATQAVRKERFLRTMIDTHVHFYFGRPMRYLKDERELYQRLWDNVHSNDFKIRQLIREIVLSPEYLGQATALQHPADRLDLASESPGD